MALLFQLVALHSLLSAGALSIEPKALELDRAQGLDNALFAVDELLWPGCYISSQYPYTADLFGFGKCAMQPCSCQEVRGSSLVWGFAARCDRTPGQIIDFVVTMRLTRDGLQYPQNITVFPSTDVERNFAEAMQVEMKKSKWSSQPIPVFEQVGIKLGTMGISLRSLRGRAGDKCRIYDQAAFAAESRQPVQDLHHGRDYLLQWALPEAFFGSDALVPATVEVRGAFPLIQIWERLGPDLVHRTIGTVLVSLGQAFLAYEEANWIHCDRQPAHILFRKSSLNRDMPSALIIDQDMTMDVVKSGLKAGEVVKVRRMMLNWFARTVHFACHRQQTKRFSQSAWSCPYGENRSENVAKEHIQALTSMPRDWSLENDCKGSHFLEKTVVIPAFRCAAGEDSCPTLGIAYWTQKVREWAEKYYGGAFQEQSRLPPADV